jgi:hypothetical protein
MGSEDLAPYTCDHIRVTCEVVGALPINLRYTFLDEQILTTEEDREQGLATIVMRIFSYKLRFLFKTTPASDDGISLDEEQAVAAALCAYLGLRLRA